MDSASGDLSETSNEGLSRDQILAHFQELTALENIDECLALLESTNWNLEQAIQLFYSGGVTEPDTGISFAGTGPSSFNPFRVNTGPANEDDYVTINDTELPNTITIDDDSPEKTLFNVPKSDLLNAGKVSVSGRNKTSALSISSSSTSNQHTSSGAKSSSSLLEQLDRYQTSSSSTTSSSGLPPLSALRPNVNQLGDDFAAYMLADHDIKEASAPAYSYHRRLLEFEIEYKQKKFQLHVSDNETVRKLKELISEELNMPLNHVTLKGWKDKDRKVTDSMQLRELNLPRESTLFVINSDQSNQTTAGASTSSGALDASTFELLIFLVETSYSASDNEDSSSSDDKQSKRTSFRLKFDPSTKFLEVKRAIAKLSHVIVFNQEWWAFSKNYVPDQNTFLLNPFDDANRASGGASSSSSSSTTTTDLFDPTTATTIVKTSTSSPQSNNSKYFQDLLANKILYSMPLSILEPDNLTLSELRNLISTVLDPDHGLSKTATSWSTVNETSSASSSVTSKNLFTKNSKLTPPIAPKSDEIKMAFVVTTKQSSVNSQESGKSAQATSSGMRSESGQTPLGFDFLASHSLEHSPLKKAKYSGLGQSHDDDAKDDYLNESIHDEEHMNVDEDEDIDDQWVVEPSNKHNKPLIPDDCPDDELIGTNAFVEEFATRYGPIIPLFFIGTLEDAIKDALLCPAKDRKLLVIYLHSDNTVFGHIFCSKALCDENVINFLASNFTVWPWDLSQKKRERYFNEKCSKHLGSVFASTICNSKKLPALVVVTRARGTNEVLGVIEGDVTTSELILDRLMQYYELFDAQRVKDERDEQGREERERIKREQDAAYQMSLENDKAKRQRQAEENEKQQQAAELERQNQLAKEKYRQECLTNLPAEPDDSVPTAKVARIRFRLPSGETLQRKFNITDKLKALIDFCIGHDYSVEEYKILSSWPRRDLTTEPADKTFEELKLFPQETVTLEQR